MMDLLIRRIGRIIRSLHKKELAVGKIEIAFQIMKTSCFWSHIGLMLSRCVKKLSLKNQKL